MESAEGEKQNESTLSKRKRTARNFGKAALIILSLYGGYKGSESYTKEMIQESFPTELVDTGIDEQNLSVEIQTILNGGESVYLQNLLSDDETYTTLKKLIRKEAKGSVNSPPINHVNFYEIKKVLKFHLMAGNPHLGNDSSYDAGRLEFFKGRAYYDPTENFIFLPSSSLDERRAELAHAYQRHTRQLPDHLVHLYYSVCKTLSKVPQRVWNDEFWRKRNILTIYNMSYYTTGTIEHEAHSILEPKIEQLTGKYDFNSDEWRTAFIKDEIKMMEWQEYRVISYMLGVRANNKIPGKDYTPYKEFVISKLENYSDEEFSFIVGYYTKSRSSYNEILQFFMPYLKKMDDNHPFKQRINKNILTDRYIQTLVEQDLHTFGGDTELSSLLRTYSRIQTVLPAASKNNEILQKRRKNNAIPVIKNLYTQQDTMEGWQEFYTNYCQRLFTKKHVETYISLLHDNQSHQKGRRAQ